MLFEKIVLPLHTEKQIKHIIMKTRKTITTEGGDISFYIDDNYYLQGGDLSLVFNGSFSNYRYCVACTSIYRDNGVRWVETFGVPALEKYDNGIFGAQNFHFYEDRAEALKSFEMRKKLTPKQFKNTFAYADVMLVENIK